MKLIILTTTALFLSACHGTPGEPNYTELPEDFRGPGAPEFKDPTPYLPGTERLSISIFYEGSYSKILILDDVQRHFYIYEGTFNIADENAIVREGLRADAVISAGTPWWGGGVTWDTAEDLSEWTTMHVSLWSDNQAYEGTEIEIEGGGVTRRIPVADYGFVPDGTWYDLAIPMSDITETGVDISAITRPFVLAGDNAPMGATLVVDNLYYE